MQNWKKVFTIIWTGQFISLITSSLVNFAIVIWLSLETGSAEVLAFAAIAALLPQSVLGLFSGVLIDRWDRKITMILSDAFIALCTLGIVILFYLGEAQLWYIYLLLAFRSIGSAFHMPAMQASIPLLAPESQLLRIAGVNQAIQSVSNIAGPALAAVAISVMDIEHVMLIDIIGAIVAIISLLFVYIPNPPQEEKTGKGIAHFFNEIKVGINVVTDNKGLAYLFLFSIIATFCLMPVAILFPLLTLQHFHGSTFQMGLIEVVWGAGMLAGGGLLGLLNVSVNKAILINMTYLVLGLSLAFSGMLPSTGFVLFVVLTTIGGIAASIYNASFTTIIQEQVKPAMLGRVFSMFFSISILPSLLGLLGAGTLAEEVGISETFIILGSLIAIVGLVACFVPSLIKLGLKK